MTDTDVLSRDQYKSALGPGRHNIPDVQMDRLLHHDAALREQNEWLREALSELHAAAGGALRAMYNEWHSAPKRDMVDEYKDLKAASDSARQVLEAIDD